MDNPVAAAEIDATEIETALIDTAQIDTALIDTALFASRWESAKERMSSVDADALVVRGGSDLFYLTGYQASSMERITAFVGRPAWDGVPDMFVPQIEVSLVPIAPDVYSVTGWTDDDDPLDMIADSIAGSTHVLVSDELWAHHLLGLQQRMPNAAFTSLSEALGGLRSVKNADEMQRIQVVGGLANEVAAQLQAGEIPLVGRTEKEIAADISSRLIAAGHETVEFCIVASGPNSASPHHHPTDRVVQADEMVLCDFGGRHNGYCSDITRCVWTGPIPDEVAATWDTLQKAQQAAVDHAQPGATLASVDSAARSIIADAGFGEYFIHRLGHGIGTEVHEQPYVKPGNDQAVVAGHAFSIEPGIYIEGKWGMRLEDIVVIVDDGAIRCSTTDHRLIAVTA